MQIVKQTLVLPRNDPLALHLNSEKILMPQPTVKLARSNEETAAHDHDAAPRPGVAKH